MIRPWQHVVVIAVIALVLAYFAFRSPNITLRSSDGKWADSEIQFKGRSFDVLVWNFERYKLECAAPNALLVRATNGNWWNVFAWPSYLTNVKWRVPYSDAHPEIGDYYPPALAKNCYNDGTADKDLKQTDANAARYLAGLSKRS